jgi:A1 cistron-splicing factor AAR2
MATLIVLDAPEGLEFGLDLLSFSVGKNFLGVSDIPPGLHVVYYGSGMTGRESFFLELSPGEICIKRWDKLSERIYICRDDEDDRNAGLPDGAAQNMRDAITRRRIDVIERLGPYPIERKSRWVNLSCFIDENVLRRANCLDTVVTQSAPLPTTPAGATNSKSGLESGINDEIDKRIVQAQYAPIQATQRREREDIRQKQKRRGVDNRVGSALTATAMDKSRLVLQLCSEYFEGSRKGILGEMQLSFLLMLLVYSNDALEHWKLLVNTLSLSGQLFVSDSKFTCAFLQLMYTQIAFIPEDFFEIEVSKDNFLRPVLSNLYESLSSSPSSSLSSSSPLLSSSLSSSLSEDVKEHRTRFFSYVQKRFSILDTNTEDICGGMSMCLVDEDRPTVVDASEAEIMGTDMSIPLSPLGLVNRDSVSSSNNNVTESDDDVIGETENVFSVAFERRKAELGGILDGLRRTSDHDESETIMRGTASASTLASRSQPPFHHKDTSPVTSGSTFNRLASPELDRFSWRYPSLYKARQAHEDMVMTSVRILDEARTDMTMKEVREGVLENRQLQEAKFFIEHETHLLQSQQALQTR